MFRLCQILPAGVIALLWHNSSKWPSQCVLLFLPECIGIWLLLMMHGRDDNLFFAVPAGVFLYYHSIEGTASLCFGRTSYLRISDVLGKGDILTESWTRSFGLAEVSWLITSSADSHCGMLFPQFDSSLDGGVRLSLEVWETVLVAWEVLKQAPFLRFSC